MLWWGWFIVGFLSNLRPWQDLGGPRDLVRLFGRISGRGRDRRDRPAAAERWARMVAGIASAAMTLTVIGAIAGIPVLAALVSSRNSNKT